MTVWKVASVIEDPEIFLVSWKVMETKEGTRHFVGYNVSGREGRVSSAIEKFDKVQMTGVTSSGRVYKLKGPSNPNLDAEYVWNRWRNINDVDEYIDVSDKL